MYGNPFPGLRAFTQDETTLFFGREGQSKELLKRLQKSRFVALVGVSGSGKSSLVRAGLLHDLNGGLMSAVESDWRVAVFRPGNNPIGNMAHALITQAELGSGEAELEDVEIAVAETTLRRGNLGLLELVRRAKTKRHKDGRPFLNENENILIVVDQFEEIFRIIEQHEQLIRLTQKSEGNSDLPGTTADDQIDHHPKEEASAFVKLLLEATSKEGPSKYDENVYIIVTMRSDYLGDTAQFGGMPERINEGQYLIPRMNRDDRRKAIVGPVAVAGGSIAEPLINQLLNDAGENPGHLPILQHALMRMWDLAGPAARSNGGLNLDHYEKIGKLTGALSQHADEAFDELSEEHQKLAAKVFKCLTEKGLANRETRRPMTIADICAVVEAKEADVKKVVECFRKQGRWFLMPPPVKDENTGEIKDDLAPGTLIDISHESLISNWKKLRQWVNEEAESARTYDRLANRAILKERGEEDFYRGPALQLALKWRHDNAPNAAWARRYHPEYDKAIAFLNASVKDTRKRRLRNYGITLFILLVVGSAIGYAGWSQRQMLRAQVIHETNERASAQEREREANKLRQDAEDAKVLAQTAASNLQTSLEKEQKAVTAAKKAEEIAIAERDKARRLQNENLEQATTQGHFRRAFDYVAAEEYTDAIHTLLGALAYFRDKELNARTGADKQKIKVDTISAQINLADIYRGRNDSANDKLAVEQYKRAIALMETTKSKSLSLTLMKAGSVWKDSTDTAELREAAKFYERAAGEYGPIGGGRYSSEAWIEAGKIHLRFMDQLGFQKAEYAFEKAVSGAGGNLLAQNSATIGEAYLKLVTDGVESDDEDDESEPGEIIRQGDREHLRREGARYFNEAADTFEDFGDLKTAAAMQLNRSEILSGSSNTKLFQESVEALISASELYGRDRNPTKQVSVLLEAGQSFLEKDTALAARLLELAAKVDQNNPSEQAATLSSIGSIYSNAEPANEAKALEYYQRAILFAREHHDKAAEVNAIIEKARAVESFAAENSQAQAEELYKQAIDVFKDEPAKQVDILVMLGRVFVGRGKSAERNDRAERFFTQALSVANEQQDKKLAAQAHLDIGSAYQPVGSLRAKSIDNFEKALAAYAALQDQYGQAMALYRLIAVKRSEALELANRSLGLFAAVIPSVQAGDQQKLANAYYAMGSMLYRQKKEYQSALDYYNKALEVFLKLPDASSRVSVTRTQIRTINRLIAEAPK